MTSASWAQIVPVPVPTQPITRTFTPLHLYFVDPTAGGRRGRDESGYHVEVSEP
jgi:hypothetical protein